MKKVLSLVFVALCAVAICCGPVQAQTRTTIDFMLTSYLTKYELPALAAAVVRDGRIVAVGAVGTRKAGSRTALNLSDRFHIGSDTKAMTSLLAAMMVEEGKLRWNSTLAEVFPELAATMNAGLRSVTVEQLLSHTSGMPADNEDLGELLEQSFAQEGNLDEIRYWFVKEVAKMPPANQPGTTFLYSNTGYVMIGAIIERVSGSTWDELMYRRVFEPLRLNSAGLGCQVTSGKIDAPLGHYVADGKVKAIMAGPNCDNPAVIGPAGIAHMSVLDFARWAGWNAGEGKRRPDLVKAATMKKLHAPVISMPEKKDAAPGTPSHGRYALGWGEVTMDWSPNPLIFHGGSNTKNLAHIWIDTKRDLAVVIMTNIGGVKANEGLMSLAKELYTGFSR